jgi:hypothetical protein
MEKSYIFAEGKSVTFTEEEIKALKAIAQEHIRFENILTKDKDGNRYPYRNRYSLEEPHLPKEEEK